MKCFKIWIYRIARVRCESCRRVCKTNFSVTIGLRAFIRVGYAMAVLIVQWVTMNIYRYAVTLHVAKINSNAKIYLVFPAI